MTAAVAEMAPEAASEEIDGGSEPATPLALLLARMQHKGNFPALSQTIGAINRIAANNDESVQTLSSALLKDFALTNKLLRLVNSSTYGQFGSSISTISRAVMILGFNAVRDLAVTLLLFEHLEDKGHVNRIKEDVIASYFSGIMAHRIAVRCGAKDAEEGFVCGVFHNLGNLLAAYYFYEETKEISRRILAGADEETASRVVLGISYEDFGIGVAQSWCLPDRIIHSMRATGAAKVSKPVTTEDKLKVTANLASTLCKIASQNSPERKAAELDELNRRYGAALNLGKNQLAAVVEDSIEEFLSESSLFVAESGKSKVVIAIKAWAGESEPGEAVEGAPPAQNVPSVPQAGTAAVGVPDNATSLATLSAGVDDITQALGGDYNLNDMLRIILETMIRGIGFTQVLLCTRDARLNRLQARFGFGPNVDEMVRTFGVPLGQSQNVFQLALDKNVDLFIADARAANISERIPGWYREKVDAQTFLLLPLVIGGKIIGLFYADRARAGELSVDPRQLHLLKTLRDQAIQAIKLKS